jgi:hypothetical protein
MKIGQLKTVENTARKSPMENGSYEAVHLTKNNETKFYLFTEVELNKGFQRAKNQPEEEIQNPLTPDLRGLVYGICVLVGMVLGALIF